MSGRLLQIRRLLCASSAADATVYPMAAVDPQLLSSVSSFEEAIRRIPGGRGVLDSYRSMGYWSFGDEKSRQALRAALKQPLPSGLGGLDGQRLRELQGRLGLLLKWSIEMCGILESIRHRSKRSCDRAEAAARVRARASLSDASGKKPSMAEVADTAASDPDAVLHQDASDYVDSLLAAARAQKDSFEMYMSTVVSRAMTLVDAEMRMWASGGRS